MASADERIWESMYRLWFSIQKYVQRVDPGASPSDYAWRVEQRVAARNNKSGENSSIDDAVQRAFRSVIHEDRRTDLRRRVKFEDRDASKIEGVPDQNNVSCDAYLVDQSHVEWQIQQIRQSVGPEMMEILEQLYGFHSDQWTIDNLARKMGVRKDTLQRRLLRVFAKLRNELRSSK
jgi:DNA-directed RNA polymerase specialized sigma24 family protein